MFVRRSQNDNQLFSSNARRSSRRHLKAMMPVRAPLLLPLEQRLLMSAIVDDSHDLHVLPMPDSTIAVAADAMELQYTQTAAFLHPLYECDELRAIGFVDEAPAWHLVFV